MTEATTQNTVIQFGTFLLDSRIFGVDLLRMREIIRPVNITRLPRSEKFMEGVINLRGQVIPIVSLRARFGLPTRPFDKETRIINMDIAHTTVGFIVDSIGHVRRFSPGEIEAPPAVAVSAASEYILGIARSGEELFTLLDVDKLISPETLKNLAQE